VGVRPAYEDAAQRQERMRLMSLLGEADRGGAAGLSTSGARPQPTSRIDQPGMASPKDSVEIIETPDGMSAQAQKGSTSTTASARPRPRPVAQRKPGF
jgi:hypothetical protein